MRARLRSNYFSKASEFFFGYENVSRGARSPRREVTGACCVQIPTLFQEEEVCDRRDCAHKEFAEPELSNLPTNNEPELLTKVSALPSAREQSSAIAGNTPHSVMGPPELILGACQVFEGTVERRGAWIFDHCFSNERARCIELKIGQDFWGVLGFSSLNSSRHFRHSTSIFDFKKERLHEYHLLVQRTGRTEKSAKTQSEASKRRKTSFLSGKYAIWKIASRKCYGTPVCILHVWCPMKVKNCRCLRLSVLQPSQK